MTGWSSVLAVALAARLALAPAFAAAPDIHAAEERPPATAAPPPPERRVPPIAWRPGDPRDLREESKPVQYLARAGFAGLGLAGLVASLATGGVAPAVGFGIITAWNALGGLSLWGTPKK